MSSLQLFEGFFTIVIERKRKRIRWSKWQTNIFVWLELLHLSSIADSSECSLQQYFWLMMTVSLCQMDAKEPALFHQFWLLKRMISVYEIKCLLFGEKAISKKTEGNSNFQHINLIKKVVCPIVSACTESARQSRYLVWFLIFAKGPLCGPLPAMNLIMVWTSRALFIQSFLPQAWITFFSALFASSLYGSRTDSNTKQSVNKSHCTVHFFLFSYLSADNLGRVLIYVCLFVCFNNAV